MNVPSDVPLEDWMHSWKHLWKVWKHNLLIKPLDWKLPIRILFYWKHKMHITECTVVNILQTKKKIEKFEFLERPRGNRRLKKKITVSALHTFCQHAPDIFSDALVIIGTPNKTITSDTQY
jgi:hypothetical protein